MGKAASNHKENRRRLKTWLILSTGILVIYGGILLLDAFFFGGSTRVAGVSILAGSPIIIFAYIVYYLFPQFRSIPLYVGIMTNIVFIAVGAYLQYLDFYFFVMILVVGTITTTKNVRQMSIFVAVSGVINILAMIFLIPNLEWLSTFRFFMQFVMYFFGSGLMLIQTYHVEQKDNRSERALAAFSALLRSTPNLMAITDAESRVLYLSDPMARFIRCPIKEYAVGQPLIDLVADEDLKFMFADMLDADGFFETIMELDMDGERRHFKIVADKLGGENEGVFIDIADITPTVKSRQDAIEAQKAAEEANKSKTNFLTSMSHEIRTPMNAILGVAQIQLQRADLPEEYASALQKIYQSGSNLLGIINDILDMSKIESGKMEINPIEYDVPSLINDAVQLNIVRIGSKPIEFLLDINENLPSRLIGDELRLKQILSNLLSNAIKYTEEGYVKLSISHSAQDGDIVLRFIVEDTGQGMTPKDQKRLFSEYSRFNAEANRDVEGTGIGLNITKNLVHLMGGTIEAESEFGKGSIFTVTVRQAPAECLPIGSELSERLRNFTFTGEKQTARQRVESMPYGKVLIVDDVETNLYVAEGLMSPYRLQIDTAISGFKAIEMVKSGKNYDVIFMDHMMPQMDGIEATQKLRGMGYEGAVIALTANALVGNDVMFKQNGFDDFISKPIDVRRLNAALNKFVRDRHSRRDAIHGVRTAAPHMYGVPAAEPTDAMYGVPTMAAIPPKLREIFCRDAGKAVAALRETSANGDVKRFTTTAHAMKSALANIGEDEKSGLAQALEHAGLNGDTDFIAANTEGFIRTLEALIARFAPPGTEADEAADRLEDTAYLAEQLTMIQAACGNYDDTAAYAALNRLKAQPWRKETSDALEAIRDALFLHSDFDGAAAMAAALAETRGASG
ncbi:MAG: ATP-binding protein [Oscillospiraceae bacterium]|nr:ATP-binding protein [Oscillospiraceae bacterium]